MNLNATMFVQSIVFLILAWIVAKFVWPPVVGALDARARKIAEGLAAADQGRQAMKEAEKRVQVEMTSAREEINKRLADAELRAHAAGDEIKANAQAEAARIVAQARAEAQQQVSKAREELRAQVATLAVRGAEQILKREVNPQVHAELLKQLSNEL